MLTFACHRRSMIMSQVMPSPRERPWRRIDCILADSCCFNRQTAGSVDASKLPGEEALNVPGKKEGENKLIRNATGAVDVYTWAGGAWMKVGEMTDGVGTGTNAKKTYNGKEWDYVFEVDAAEGAPKLMLPYNANGMRSPILVALTLILRRRREPIRRRSKIPGTERPSSKLPRPGRTIHRKADCRSEYRRWRRICRSLHRYAPTSDREGIRSNRRDPVQVPPDTVAQEHRLQQTESQRDQILSQVPSLFTPRPIR